jgi:acyl carrier protein
MGEYDRAPAMTAPESALPPAGKTIVDTIELLLRRRGAVGLAVTPEARLTADLGMDSLELAELSAVLEDDLGRDPFSEGIVPRTVGELLAYYHP